MVVSPMPGDAKMGSSAKAIAMVCAFAAALLLAVIANAAPTTQAIPTTLPGGLQELPEFGVGIPPAPKGFEPVSELSAGMFSAEIAVWRRLARNGGEERITLAWTLIPMMTFN